MWRDDGPRRTRSSPPRLALLAVAVTGALGLALLPRGVEGSPRRSAARTSVNGRRVVALRVAELGVGPATGLLAELRGALVEEGAAHGELLVVTDESPSRFNLRAAVTRFERERGSFGYRVRCAVSILVEEARGGRVRMVLSGRATSEGEVPRTPTRARSIDVAALRGAVRGALRGVTRRALLAPG